MHGKAAVPMNSFKNYLLWILIGVVAGAAVASLIAPSALAWNNTPGQGQALCDCVSVTKSTAAQLIEAQLIGGAVGGVLFAALGAFLVRRGRGSKNAPTAVSGSGPAV